MDEVVVATVDETLVEANIIDTDMSGTIVVAAGESALRHFGPKTDTYTSRRFGAGFVAWDSIILSQAMGPYFILSTWNGICCTGITHFADLVAHVTCRRQRCQGSSQERLVIYYIHLL